MKKKLINMLAAVSLLTASAIQAQTGFSVSIKAVPQISFLQNSSDNDNSRYESKTTFNAAFGAGIAYNFDKRSGIGLDVFYSLQGQRYLLNGTEYNQKLDYIKIPLMYTYTTNALKAISFVGKIGPQLNILSASKLTDKDGNDLVENTKARYESATVGGVAIAGAQFKLAPRTYLTTAVRFDYDFINAEDDTYAGYTANRASTYNITLGLEVGLKFMLK